MKVSILVPIYNVERFFAPCLNSIFSQTHKDIEYVFVNDCTPDNSMAVLKKVAANYPERMNDIRIIENKVNQGIAKVRNTLLDNATGDYILFVDSDDWIEKDMVELLVKEAETQKADIVGCDYCEDYPDHRVVVRQDYPQNHVKAMKAMTLLSIKGVLWKLLIRRSLYVSNRLRFVPDIQFGEDYIFCCKLFFYSRHIANVAIPLYHYVQYNPNNYCSQNSDKRIDSFAEAIKEVELFYKANGVYATLEKELNKRKFLIKSVYVLDRKKRDIKKWATVFPEANGAWRELGYSWGNSIKFFLAETASHLYSHFSVPVAHVYTCWKKE